MLLKHATLILAFPLTAAAQQEIKEAPAWFEGRFIIGTRPASTDEPITVWAVRSINDVTLCGTTKVNGGEYKLAIENKPKCTSTSSVSPVTYIFGWNGEQVGWKQVIVHLNWPHWNQSYRVNLVQGPVFPIDRPPNMTDLVLRRFYGKLTIGDQPGFAGETITLYRLKGGSRIKCGEGTTGDDGYYFLDVPLNSGCESSSGGRYQFMSRGQLAGEFEGSMPPDPVQVGIVLARNLHVTS